MNDLETALTDLAEHLDAPDGVDLAARVRADIVAAEDRPVRLVPRDERRRAWMLAAAAVAIVLLGLVALPATRTAIAGWLGIGAVEIRHAPVPAPGSTPETRPTGSTPVPGSVPPAGTDAVSRPEDAVADAQARVGFPIRVPTDPAAGSPTAVAVDERPSGGLVALTYPWFTVVEIASSDDQPPIGKTLGAGTTLEPATVDGHPGFWISGDPHEIAYLDRDGSFQIDTVRRSGNVLLWVEGGVTYRIEGPISRGDAEQIAVSMRPRG